MPTQSEAAAHVDLQPRQLRELRDMGRVPDPRTVTLDEFRVAYIRQLRETALGRVKADGQPAGSAKVTLEAERARLAKEQADGLELKNAQTRGELIPRDEHERTIVDLASIVAQRLSGLPTKAAPLAHTAESMAEAEVRIRRVLNELLTELADEGVTAAERLASADAAA